MKRALSTTIVVFLVLLLHGYFSLLSAGQVTLEISTTTSLSQGSIISEFKITNKGSEPARLVSVLGKFLDQRQSVFIAVPCRMSTWKSRIIEYRCLKFL